jgi:hypothetical protein
MLFNGEKKESAMNRSTFCRALLGLPLLPLVRASAMAAPPISHFPSGTLAETRLGTALTSYFPLASHMEAEVVKAGNVAHTSGILSKAKTKEADLLHRWIALLKSDALFFAERQREYGFGPATETTDTQYRLSLWEGKQPFQFFRDPEALTITISPKSHRLEVQGVDKKRHVMLNRASNYDAIGAPLYTLLKDTFPAVDEVQKLAFAPLPAWPIDKRIPATVLESLKKLQPGTTRAEVQRLLKEQGGISNRYRRTYIWPERLGSQECIHVAVEFAPKNHRILWHNNQGYDLDYGPIASGKFAEQPDDVVLYVAPPVVGYMVMD